MHPSITKKAIEELHDILQVPNVVKVFESVNMNNFQLISKNINLFHVFNVLKPIVHESSEQLLETLHQTNFDDNLLT